MPAETHGKPVLDFVFCHQGPDAIDFVQPLRELGEPILDAVAVTSHVETQTTFDANMPKGLRSTSKAHDLTGLTDGAIDTMVEPRPTAPTSSPGGPTLTRTSRSWDGLASSMTRWQRIPPVACM